MLDAIERAALRVLIRELGLLRALSVGLRVQWRTARGEPFADFGPAEGFQEIGSRAQVGPTVVMFRALRDQVGTEEALRVVGAVVEASAMVFLAQSLGPLKRDQLADMTPEETEAFAAERASMFPNATVTWDEVSRDRVRFTVTACRLAELSREVGCPELAPLFCRGDARYFAESEPGVDLIRPTTLAEGGASCPFTLQWADE